MGAESERISHPKNQKQDALPLSIGKCLTASCGFCVLVRLGAIFLKSTALGRRYQVGSTVCCFAPRFAKGRKLESGNRFGQAYSNRQMQQVVWIGRSILVTVQ
jgi:hypothetical protein